MAMDYQICLISPQNNPHAACFFEVAKLLFSSMRSLGYSCDSVINELDANKMNIVLGSNTLQTDEKLRGKKYIIYQLEQLSEKEGWYSPLMERVLKNATVVWDYSKQNIQFLEKRGINAQYLPLGYHRALEMIPTSSCRDIDILFYGSINARRQQILKRILEEKRSNLKVVFGAYGQQRDELIARSRIILNIHYYATNIFEAVRISYLLNNACAVISEESPLYPYPGVDLCMVPYEKIMETCYRFLEHPDEIEQYRQRSYEQFKRLYPMQQFLEAVIKG